MPAYVYGFAPDLPRLFKNDGVTPIAVHIPDKNGRVVTHLTLAEMFTTTFTTKLGPRAQDHFLNRKSLDVV